MAYARPTFTQIKDRVSTDIESRTDGSALYARSVERSLAFVLSKVADAQHAHVDSAIENMLPDRCERSNLLRWADALGLSLKTATYAVRVARFTGTGTPSLAVGASVQLEDGTLYTVTTGGTMAADVLDVTVTADVAGTDGNVLVGAVISLVVPVAGIASDGSVLTETTDAIDDETTEALRVRVLQRLRTPPSGGGPGDYVAWALEVDGVTRAWEFGNREGVGTVTLAFVRDDDGGSIIPDAAEIATVQAYIDARRPLDMREFFGRAPVDRSIDMTIAISPNTTAVQDAIEAQLVDLFETEAGVEVSQPVASKYGEAISVATGETDHSITLIDGGALSAYDPDPGEFGLNTLGTITWATL